MTRRLPCNEKEEAEPHHFLIEPFTEPESKGICKKCGWEGEELDREFWNYRDHTKPVMINGKIIIRADTVWGRRAK
jgi:hypothetical protein